QVCEFESVAHALLSFVRGALEQTRKEEQILLCGEAQMEGPLVGKHHAYLGAKIGSVRLKELTVERDGSGVRNEDAGKTSHKRSLAGTVRAGQSRDARCRELD
ncbi:MAG: hypothetical protein ACJA1R_002516, partial [Flavobacteriales bacterium]